MMTKKINIGAILVAAIFAINLAFPGFETEKPVESADDTKVTDDRIYELRTYTTHPGKLEDLHSRFKNHTVQLFAKYGMVSVGYWVPVDQDNTLIYILSHNSREAAEKSWDGFRNDPDWQRAYEASRADGPIVSNVESVFMKATPYSQIR
ncbi:MAG: NIPSNAP family protein [Balneolaceae bacterium]